MGQNSVSQVRHKGTQRQGRSLPYARPYRTQSLGPKILGGACRRPLFCSQRPRPMGRPEGAQHALKWLKITKNGSGGPPDCVQRGYPRSPPANCQEPTNNHQPPSTANHHQPPTANRQPPATPTAINCQPTTRPAGSKHGPK